MKHHRTYFIRFIPYFILFQIIVGCTNAHAGKQRAELFGLWGIQLINNNIYRNPFDFHEIELQATFTSLSGRKINFFGFYDGDGKGGQNGNIWRLRFMPDEIGNWTYVYTWTDGTPGGSSSFYVISSSNKGILSKLPENPRFFHFANGEVFYPRAYYLSEVFGTNDENIWKGNGIDKYFGGKYKYNLIVTTFWQLGSIKSHGWDAWGPSYTYNLFFPILDGDYTRYDVKSWTHLYKVLKYLNDKSIVWYNFDGFYPNVGGDLHKQDQSVQNNFIKYYLARVAAYQYVIWNIGFEYDEFMSDLKVSEIAEYIKANDPFDHPLSVRGKSTPPNFEWLDYTQVQISAGSEGDAKNVYNRILNDFRGRNKPVACVECSWEGINKLNENQVRKGAWGITLAGGFHVYGEQFSKNGGHLYGDGGAFSYLVPIRGHNYLN